MIYFFICALGSKNSPFLEYQSRAVQEFVAVIGLLWVATLTKRTNPLRGGFVFNEIQCKFQILKYRKYQSVRQPP